MNNVKERVLILFGHTDTKTFIGALADKYESGARDAGYEVRRVNIGALVFDPVMYKGYKEVQELEPDLATLQKDILWCNHFVLFYPMWWGGMPAKLKGMFDRAFHPGFAFKYKNKETLFWEKLLKGRRATVFITMDSPPLFARFFVGNNVNEIRRNILKFCGFSPVRVHEIGSVKLMSDKKRERVKEKLYRVGQRGK